MLQAGPRWRSSRACWKGGGGGVEPRWQYGRLTICCEDKVMFNVEYGTLVSAMTSDMEPCQQQDCLCFRGSSSGGVDGGLRKWCRIRQSRIRYCWSR